jgi:hypothetical protein
MQVANLELRVTDFVLRPLDDILINVSGATEVAQHRYLVEWQVRLHMLM